jgi:hypothetical protein
MDDAPEWGVGGYISDAVTISASALRKRLMKAHKGLKEIKQADEDEEQPELEYLEGVGKELVSTEVLGHSNQEVRLMSMCCLVDVLRVYAPDAPFDDVEIQVRVCAVPQPREPRSLHAFRTPAHFGPPTSRALAHALSLTRFRSRARRHSPRSSRAALLRGGDRGAWPDA